MSSKTMIGALALAGGVIAGSTAHGAVVWTDTEMLTAMESERLHFPGWDSPDVNPRGADDGIVETVITLPNFIGTDLISMNIKILPDDETTYGPGEFEAIVFDDLVVPTATKFGMPVGSFSHTNDKEILWTFDPGDYATGDFVTFTFTVLTPNMQLFDVEFEPNIPTPGTLALTGVAGLACVRRRR